MIVRIVLVLLFAALAYQCDAQNESLDTTSLILNLQKADSLHQNGLYREADIYYYRALTDAENLNKNIMLSYGIDSSNAWLEQKKHIYDSYKINDSLITFGLSDSIKFQLRFDEANYYFDRGDFQAAILEYQRALIYRPSDSLAYYSYVKCLQNQTLDTIRLDNPISKRLVYNPGINPYNGIANDDTIYVRTDSTLFEGVLLEYVVVPPTQNYVSQQGFVEAIYRNFDLGRLVSTELYTCYCNKKDLSDFEFEKLAKKVNFGSNKDRDWNCKLSAREIIGLDTVIQNKSMYSESGNLMLTIDVVVTNFNSTEYATWYDDHQDTIQHTKVSGDWVEVKQYHYVEDTKTVVSSIYNSRTGTILGILNENAIYLGSNRKLLNRFQFVKQMHINQTNTFHVVILSKYERMLTGYEILIFSDFSDFNPSNIRQVNRLLKKVRLKLSTEQK